MHSHVGFEPTRVYNKSWCCSASSSTRVWGCYRRINHISDYKCLIFKLFVEWQEFGIVPFSGLLNSFSPWYSMFFSFLCPGGVQFHWVDRVLFSGQTVSNTVLLIVSYCVILFIWSHLDILRGLCASISLTLFAMALVGLALWFLILCGKHSTHVFSWSLHATVLRLVFFASTREIHIHYKQ